MKNYAEQIRAFIPKGRAYKVLGTDGFGRSDFRSKLREHFEINRHYIVVAALKALADEGTVPASQGGRGDREVRHRRRQDQPAVRLNPKPPGALRRQDNTWHLVEVKVPDIGDFKDVAVIELLVKPGDTVAAEQSLLTVESDKASMEIPSSHAGVVKELKVKLGDKVSEGTLIWCWKAMLPLRPLHRFRLRSAAPQRPVAAAAAAPRRRRAATGPIEVLRARHRRLRRSGRDRGVRQARRHVKVEQSLITVESDKASMEIPSSHAGVVRSEGQGGRQGRQGQPDRLVMQGVVLAAAVGAARRTGRIPRRPVAPAPAATAAQRRTRRRHRRRARARTHRGQGRPAARIAHHPPAGA
jgi:pyruvate dehydrogenase E2 component (dihydrolipoamide acetyltransferase)